MDKIGTKVPMYYNNREIVLEEQWDDASYACEGCVLDDVVGSCAKAINPPQDHTVCCPRGQNEMYIFKYKEE